MAEEIKERLSKTEYDLDFSKINFEELRNIKPTEDNREYKITTGELPIELLKAGVSYGRRDKRKIIENGI